MPLPAGLPCFTRSPEVTNVLDIVSPAGHGDIISGDEPLSDPPAGSDCRLHDFSGPARRSPEEPFTCLAGLSERPGHRHLGLSIVGCPDQGDGTHRLSSAGGSKRSRDHTGVATDAL